MATAKKFHSKRDRRYELAQGCTSRRTSEQPGIGLRKINNSKKGEMSHEKVSENPDNEYIFHGLPAHGNCRKYF